MSALREVCFLEQDEPRAKRTWSARFRGALLIAGALSFAFGGPVQAENLLGVAKEAGQVGEKPDGYIGLINQSAPEEIKKMVEDTNERRMAKYTSIAKQRGSTVESVAKQAGEKLSLRIKPGEMFQNADGKWVKK